MRTRREQHGQVLPLVALMFFAFIGFAMLAVDGAHLYSERRTLQKASDLASLACARAYYDANYAGRANTNYPSTAANGVAAATPVARTTAFANEVKPGATVTVDFIDHNRSVIPDPITAGPADIRGCRLTITENVANYFGPAVGIPTSSVSAVGTAQIGSPNTSLLAPLVLHNWDSGTYNVPRDSAYGGGGCAPNPGDGNQYPSVPDCRPSLGANDAQPINLVPYYETSAPSATLPSGGFAGAPSATYSVIHDRPSCQTGDSGNPPPYSICSADHGAGFLGVLEQGFGLPLFTCTGGPGCSAPSYNAEQTRRRLASNPSYNWIQRNPSTRPQPRAYPSMAYDPVHHLTVMFGGYTTTYQELNDTWVYDMNTDQWTQICNNCGPPGRFSAGMAWDATRGQIVMFGGYSSTQAQSCGACGFFNDTWTLDVQNGWQQKFPASSPSGRWYPSMSPDSQSDIVLFGGLSAGNPPTYLADTWTWNGNDWTARCGTGGLGSCVDKNTGVGLSGRWETRLAYAAPSGKATLYAGDNGAASPYLADTWSWDGTGWIRENPTGASPGPRTNLQTAYNTIPSSTGPSILLYGGGDASNIYDDTYTLQTGPPSNGFTKLTPAANPGKTRSAGMAYDSDKNVVVLFGGGQPSANGASTSNNTWIFTTIGLPPQLTFDDDYVLTAFQDRINRAVAAGSKWAQEDCSLPHGGPGVQPLRSDNPRLVRLPVEYGPAGQLPAVAGQNNVGRFKISETVDFCIQSPNGPSAGLPARSATDNSYLITGYIVEQPQAGFSGLSLGVDYFGRDVVDRLVPNP